MQATRSEHAPSTDGAELGGVWACGSAPLSSLLSAQPGRSLPQHSTAATGASGSGNVSGPPAPPLGAGTSAHSLPRTPAAFQRSLASARVSGRSVPTASIGCELLPAVGGGGEAHQRQHQEGEAKKDGGAESIAIGGGTNLWQDGGAVLAGAVQAGQCKQEAGTMSALAPGPHPRSVNATAGGQINAAPAPPVAAHITTPAGLQCQPEQQPAPRTGEVAAVWPRLSTPAATNKEAGDQTVVAAARPATPLASSHLAANPTVPSAATHAAGIVGAVPGPVGAVPRLTATDNPLPRSMRTQQEQQQPLASSPTVPTAGNSAAQPHSKGPSPSTQAPKPPGIALGKRKTQGAAASAEGAKLTATGAGFSGGGEQQLHSRQRPAQDSPVVGRTAQPRVSSAAWQQVKGRGATPQAAQGTTHAQRMMVHGAAVATGQQGAHHHHSMPQGTFASCHVYTGSDWCRGCGAQGTSVHRVYALIACVERTPTLGSALWPCIFHL
jgi:hypothetical protein